MYKRILLATDGAVLAKAAVQRGIRLASRLGAAVVVVYASPATSKPGTPIADAAVARHLNAVRADAKRAGVECTVLHLEGLRPADAIVASAKAEFCDLVVVGSHGRPASEQLWLGSVTTRVLATCSIPVLVYRAGRLRGQGNRGTDMYRRILVCTDGSALSTLAAKHAVGLAKGLDASLHAVYVTPPFLPPEGFEASPLMPLIRKHVSETRAVASRHLGVIARRAERAGVECNTHHVGGMSAARMIVDTARRTRCDLVVMGSHGRDRIKQVLLGSVTTRVLETSAISVLVARQDVEQATSGEKIALERKHVPPPSPRTPAVAGGTSRKGA